MKLLEEHKKMQKDQECLTNRHEAHYYAPRFLTSILLFAGSYFWTHTV